MLYDRVILQYNWTIGIYDYCDIATLEATTDLTQLLTLKAIHVYNVLFCIEYQAEKKSNHRLELLYWRSIKL